jgi:hypothetical protein
MDDHTGGDYRRYSRQLLSATHQRRCSGKCDGFQNSRDANSHLAPISISRSTTADEEHRLSAETILTIRGNEPRKWVRWLDGGEESRYRSARGTASSRGGRVESSSHILELKGKRSIDSQRQRKGKGFETHAAFSISPCQ